MNETTSNIVLNKKIHFSVIAFAWLCVQAISFYRFGIVTNYEAGKYVEQANLLLSQGHFSSNNFLFYSTEILLIAFSLKFHLGFMFVVIVQWVCNAISVFLLYKLIERFTKRPLVAFLYSLIFLGLFYYQAYNVHLFSESLFFSFTIIFAYILFSITRFSLASMSLILGFLVLFIFTRPTGLLFIPPTIIYLILRFGKKNTKLLLVGSGLMGLIAFYFLLNAALASGGEFDFLLPYIQEHIICGVPSAEQTNQIIMPVNKNSIEGFWYLIKNNHELFLKLAAKRFVVFWGVQRSYYSFAHNLFICVYFYLIYLLLVFGIRKILKTFLPQTIFLLAYILLVTITVMLTCDEWHNRFIYSILPFLLILSSGAFIKKNTMASTNKDSN